MDKQFPKEGKHNIPDNQLKANLKPQDIVRQVK